MSDKDRPTIEAMQDVDVVPGEGGEAPMSPTGGDTGMYGDPYDTDYDYGDYGDYGSGGAGATHGIATLPLEVAILSNTAINQIAEGIAKRVADKVRGKDIKTVTVVSPAVIAFLRLHAALEADVSSLEAVIKTVPSTSPQGGAAPEGFAFPITPQKVKQAASSAIATARIFAVTTSYSGRANTARQSAVDAALAKYLAALGLNVEVPEHALPTTEPRGLIARLLALQARCQELEQSSPGVEAVSEVLSTVSNLLQVLFGTGEAVPEGALIAQQLMLADGIARGMEKGKAVLFAEIAFSGGSYRTRKWIFNYLLGRDGLTYSGGAGVTYFLFDASDRSTLDSDTLYFASPHSRFDQKSIHRFRPTNVAEDPNERS